MTSCSERNPSGRSRLRRAYRQIFGGQPLPAQVPAHHPGLEAVLRAANLPGITWIPSPNYSPNRDGHNPNWTAADPTTWLVYHTQVGFMASTIAAFQRTSRQASATYLVGLDGSIVQMVRETDAPWTNGTYANDPGSNLDSITIEFEDGGDYNGPRTPALYKTGALLTADIHRRRAIPVIHRGTGGGELRHRECNGASTSCPDSLDIDRLIREANVYLAGGDPYAPTPTPAPTPAPTPTPVPTGDDDMLYVGAFHPAPGTVRLFVAGQAYHDPSSAALVTGPLGNGTQVSVTGYRYSNSPVQTSNLGNGSPGPDYIWWRLNNGQWLPDAYLDTTGLAGAPSAIGGLPANETLGTYFTSIDAGGADDDSAYATKTDLNNAIAGLPKPPSQVVIPAVTIKLS